MGAHTTSSSRLFFLPQTFPGVPDTTSAITASIGSTGDTDIANTDKTSNIGFGTTSDSNSTGDNVNDKGIHTERSKNSVSSDRSSNWGVLIDSPGTREIGLWHLPLDVVKAGFEEIEELAGQCKFRNCDHGYVHPVFSCD